MERGSEPAAVSAARATLDAWRASGADHADPMRFRVIDALERRAARHHGETRRVLDERIGKLIAEYGEAASASSVQVAPIEPGEAGALATLVAYLSGTAANAAYPELPALDDFRELWAKVRTDQQVRQSLEQVPGNAGPLNSSSLVHRSLSLMRELSPGYLKQFLSYLDALTWMEQMSGGMSPTKDAPQKDAPRKTARATSSKSTRGKSR